MFLGYGFELSLDDTSFGHTGKNDGFRTRIWVNPDNGLYVIILGNGGIHLPDYNYLIELLMPFVE